MSRLTPEEAAAVLKEATPIPSGRGPRTVELVLRGVDPAGDPVTVVLVRPTVVLALSTTCDGCRELAEVVREGAEDFEVVGILRAPRDHVTGLALAEFAAGGGRWVFGEDPFEVLGIGAPPFFCVVDEGGAVVVEGVAFGRGHLEEHLARVRAGAPRPDSMRLTPPRAL